MTTIDELERFLLPYCRRENAAEERKPYEEQFRFLVNKTRRQFGGAVLAADLLEAWRRAETRAHEEQQAFLRKRIRVAQEAKALMQRFPAETFGESVELGLTAGDPFATEVIEMGYLGWQIPCAGEERQ